MMSILDAFAGVKDTRKSQGGSYKLNHILTAILLAKLSGCTSLRSMAVWMSGAKDQLNSELNFGWTRTPKKSGLSAILKTVSPEALSEVLWATADRQKGAIHADGKALRGEAALALSIFDSVSHECLARVAFGAGHEVECLAHWIKAGQAKGQMITADAAHTQKKHLKQPSKKETV